VARMVDNFIMIAESVDVALGMKEAEEMDVECVDTEV
jgi:hypothetical protein